MIGLKEKDRHDLLSLMTARASLSPERKYECRKCEDSFVVLVTETVNEDKLFGVAAFQKWQEQNKVWTQDRKELFIVKQYHIRCDECLERARDRKKLEFGKTRSRGKGHTKEPVSFKFIEAVAAVQKTAGSMWKTDPLILAKRDVVNKPESVYLVGPTGSMKTIVMEYWWNLILRSQKGDASQMYWTSEFLAFKSLRTDANVLLDALEKKKWVFFDEVFYPPEWKNQEKEGFLNAIQFSGWRTVWEYLSANRDISVFCSSNQKYTEAVKDEQEPLVRRYHDVFGGGAGVVEL